MPRREDVDEQHVAGRSRATARARPRRDRGAAWSRSAPTGCPAREPEATAAAGSRRAAPGARAATSSRPSIVRPASMLMIPGQRRARAPTRARCGAARAGACASRDEAHDAQTRAEHREHRRDAVTSTSAVARNRLGSVTESAAAVTTGAGDVVEVPVVAHAERGDGDRDHHDDDDRDDAAEHRDDDEVGDRDRVVHTERDGESLRDDREQERRATSTARPRTRGSGRRACRCATTSR